MRGLLKHRPKVGTYWNGARLRAIREEQQVTVSQLAAALGVAVKTLQSYESSDSAPPLDVFRSMCQYLVLDPLQIYELFKGTFASPDLTRRFREACAKKGNDIRDVLLSFMALYAEEVAKNEP